MTTLTEAVPVPDHIPAEAVFDFDFRYDPGLVADPHQRLTELLEEAPRVFWTPRNTGTWIAIGFNEVFDALRRPETFSSSIMPREEIEALLALLPDDQPRIPQLKPITIDPPEHTAIRTPLQKAFSPKAAMGQLAEIEKLCTDLIDAVIDKGHCEFISAIAEPLPVTVFLQMMGLPADRLPEFRELVHEILVPDLGPFDGPLVMRKIADVLQDNILARKEERQDDILSRLWDLEVDGKPMTLDVMEDYAVLLFIAGLDTVINAMGFAVRHLAENPALQQQLREDLSLIPDAVEEMLRRYSFVVPLRRVAHDTELGGMKMKQGDRLMLHLGGADLDRRKFDDPEGFDLSRDLKSHVAFGGGPHRCVGMHLARIELHAIYRHLLSRLPMWRLDPDRPPKFHAGNVIAVDSLHIRWD